MNGKPKKYKPFGWPFWLVLIGIFLILYSIAPPTVICQKELAYRKAAESTAKSLAIALFSFSEEFGSYPNESTVTLVNETYPDHGYDLSGNSSNALFRQLMASKFIESEHIFYAKISNSVKPDDNIAQGEALKKGECNFAYISGLNMTGNPLTPLVLTPLISGTTKFDPKPFDGKAIILHIDNSVTTHEIHKDGHIYDKDGDILSPKHPIWKGKAPDIRYPE